jgi:hypothetical protein
VGIRQNQLALVTVFCKARQQQLLPDMVLLCLPRLHSAQLTQIVLRAGLSIRVMTQRRKNPEGHVICYNPFRVCHISHGRLATEG